jgi:uncharacterized protein
MNEPEPAQSAELTAIPFHAPTQEERNWGLFAHLSAFSGYLGVPFGSILGPFIIWLVKRDTSGYVAEQAKEALNFQLSMLLYMIVSLPLLFVLIGFALIFVIPILAFVFTIIGSIRASEGRMYRYPLTIRFVR